jgi:hypothetical protein
MRPIITFLEKNDWEKLEERGLEAGWNFYDSSHLDELPNHKRGILLLEPSEYRGLNTPFAMSSQVLIGCVVTKET